LRVDQVTAYIGNRLHSINRSHWDVWQCTSSIGRDLS
jgi:hypothetical protein